MTVFLEPAEITIGRLVKGISRYKQQTPIYYGEHRLLTFDIYVRKKYVPNGSENVILITSGLEYRPDLVAYDVYGVPDVWWKIMEVNGIKDVFDFKAGLTIVLPKDIF